MIPIPPIKGTRNNSIDKVFFFRGSPHDKSSKVGFFGTGAKFDLFVGGEAFSVGGGEAGNLMGGFYNCVYYVY